MTNLVGDNGFGNTRMAICFVTAILLVLAGGCESGGASDGSGGDGSGDGEDGDTSGTDGEDTDTRVWVEEEIDPETVPEDVPTVEIIIAAADQASLDAAPFYGDDVEGAFIDGSGERYELVDLNYRGAYALLGLLNNDPIGRRNWKVKFPKDNMYRGRREWNFNFEPHLRQKLAYDLMTYAGVKVPSAQHVVLKVNGETMGLYLQYEDPDSKDWLFDAFGNDEGDLYKVATDKPASEGQPDMKYFADTTYLGDLDTDYLLHYNKKTNHKDPLIADDYSVVRNFLFELNDTPDGDFESWITAAFDVDAFISYLVVSNFISNWDGFSQRPKNFWLFENRRTDQMVYIPWDMDATFQTWRDDFNQMGTDASVFFDLRSADYSPIHSEEGTERPLARRLFDQAVFEEAYIARYRELADTILSEDYLQDRIDALNALVQPALSDRATPGGWTGSSSERIDYEADLEDVRAFVTDRAASVSGQLSAL
jgi:spore coat protein CotH